MTKNNVRLAFAGTPELARIVLESILQAKQHTVELVLTQPDRPSGRGRKLKQSEVKQLALEHHLPVVQPEKSHELDPDILDECDLMLVVAYGLMIPTTILNKPKYGCINIHTSLLPRWRGAAPIQRAIEAGDSVTGISFMKMDAGLDTGPILEQIKCEIHEDDTGGKLHDRLAELSAVSINSILTKISRNEIHELPQDDSKATYAHKISKSEAKLDWTKTAVEIERKTRAFNPYPISHTQLNGIEMRIWEAKVSTIKENYKPGTIIKDKKFINVATEEGILSISKLQLPGKKIITAKDFINSHPDFFD